MSGEAGAGGAGGGTVTVRAAVPGDEAMLAAFVAAVARESEGRALDERVVAAGVAESLADPSHRRYLVAERGGVAVGCLLVTTEWSDWTANWYWWLQSVYVRPEARGSGVLEALVAFVGAQARGEGVRLVRLYVDAANTRARRAYDRLGFRQVAYEVHERDA